jgi:molybdenum-dependent DNA-binding transcriptional regulator ModE
LKTPGEKLTPKQEQAIIALLSEHTIKAAGKAAGVSETSLWRWLQLPEFQRRYRAARRQVVESSIGRLQQGCDDAVTVLRLIARDTRAPASSRVAAARTIIEQSLRAIELEDLTERIERLEKTLEQKAGKQRWG